MVKRRLSESISAASPSVIRATASVLHNPAQTDQSISIKAGTEQYDADTAVLQWFVGNLNFQALRYS